MHSNRSAPLCCWELVAIFPSTTQLLACFYETFPPKLSTKKKALLPSVPSPLLCSTASFSPSSRCHHQDSSSDQLSSSLQDYHHHFVLHNNKQSHPDFLPQARPKWLSTTSRRECFLFISESQPTRFATCCKAVEQASSTARQQPDQR